MTTACGYPETRHHFFPPLARVNTTGAKTYQEYFLKYDIEVCLDSQEFQCCC